MARGVELATAYVSIAAETSQLPRDMAAAFGQGSKIALKAGRDMGKAVSKGYSQEKAPDFDKLAKDAELADEKVAASAERGAKAREAASRAVQIAEKRVQEVRERSIRQDGEVKAAEKALADARKSGDVDRLTRAEKALADAREDVTPSSADLAANDRLAKARDAERIATQKAEGELKGYVDAQRRASEALGEATREAKDAEQWTDNAGNAFQRLGGRVQDAFKGNFKGAFKPVEREAANSADEVAEEFEDAGDDSGEGMLSGMKGVLLGAAGALGIGASFGELFQQGMASVSSKAQLKASLGISDADAEALGQDASAAYRAGFGEDAGAATTAAADVRKFLGPDVDTQWATETSLAMAQAFGNDPQDNIRAVSQLIRTGMVKDAREGFDVLTKGFQSGADKAGDLTDTMTEYGTLFRNLGIDGSTSVGLMTQGLNAGARDADKVADAFKEFSIRAVDGSEGTADAFNALGLDADDMARRIGAGGETARDATQEVLEKLGGVEDPATQAQIAVGLFGTQAEDLGGALYALDLDTAATDMGTVAGASDTMADSLLEAQSPIDRLKRAFSGLGKSAGAKLIDPLNKAVDVVIRIGEFVAANPLVFGILASGLTAAGVAAYFASGAAKALFLSLSTGIKSIPVIGWVIAGITLLVAGLTWFFTKTEAGQEIWAKVWGGIKSVFQGVMNWFTGTVMPLFKTVWGILFEGDFKGGSSLSEDSPIVGALFTIRETVQKVFAWIRDVAVPWAVNAWHTIADGAVWLWENGIKPAWDGISSAISAVVEWIMNTAIPWLQSAWDAISAAMTWLYETIIKPVWDGIRIAIAIVVTAVMIALDLLKWYFNNVLAPVFTWLYETIIKPVWEGIKAAIEAVVNWFRDTAWPAIGSVIDWIRDKFEMFKLGLSIIWNFIKNNVIAPVISWFQNTVWPIIDTVIGWIKQSFEGWKIIISAVWNFVKDRVIAPVVAWFRDTAWPLFRKIIDQIAEKFTGFRNRLRDIWNFIKDNVIAPVINWIVDTVKPKLDTFVDNVKTGFNNLKDGVLAAWDKIKDGMKKPINGVIGIYNEHLAGNFNQVADTLNLDKKYRLPEMAEFARGGWTGPGSKYQEAGIVHADEFVIRKESQRDLRSNAPGFLDSLNRYGARALGYAGGGLVRLQMPFSGSYPRGDGYGARNGRHKGIDWPIPSGTVLNAVGAGAAGRTWNPAAGNKLNLNLGGGLVAGYHHLSGYAVKNGATVAAGAPVGYVGNTGRSSGPHLHFSLKRDGKYVDPAPYLGAGGEAGTGEGGGWWNPFAGLWERIKSTVADAVGDNPVGGMAVQVAKNTVTGLGDWVTDKINAVGDFVNEGAKTVGGYARWSPVASMALGMTGQSITNLPALMRRMNQESGYNPRAINNWDSNARAGIPSKGLMQVIDPTFRAYAEPGYDTDIYDPLSNILASINYAVSRYGSLSAAYNRRGGYAEGGLVGGVYDNGGWLKPGEIAMNLSNKPEPVFSASQWDTMERAAGGGMGSTVSKGGNTYHITIPADPSEDRTVTARRVSEVLDFRELNRTVAI